MTATSPSPEHRAHTADPKPGSDRSFGIVFAVVFAVIGLGPLVHGGDVRTWSLGVAGAFLLVALVAPAVLRPLNLVWFRFGLLLHAIVNPVIMGLLFFVAIMPVGLLMRVFGKDPLNRQFDKQADSYWIHRAPPGPAPDGMKNQF